MKDIILLIQPTSPLRKVKHIKDVIKIIIRKQLDSVWSVSKVDLKFHPFKQLIIKDKNLNYFDKKGQYIIARQQLKDTFYRNGVVYAFSRKSILDLISYW